MTNKFELVFIPLPGRGHLVSTVEITNILIARDPRLAITMLVMKTNFDAKFNEYIQSLSDSRSNNTSIRFIVLPELPPPPKDENQFWLKVFIESYKPLLKQALISSLTSNNHLAGFVLDMFCSTMVEVANEFEVPSYVYYTSGGASLAVYLHLEQLYSQNNSSNKVIEQLKDSDVNLSVSSLVNHVPSKVISSTFFINESAVWFHEQIKRIRSDVKGILINTFREMEPNVIPCLSTDSSLQLPPLYSVGPVLHLKKNVENMDHADILKWLDDQPSSSVVFLCFGSGGSFEKEQVEEIARALERSRVRFVWSLRQPSPKGTFPTPIEFTNFEDILPEGFLNRTLDVGRVIGWAPQVEILAHPATGGFVSHRGWNSTLESLWHGVPMATWPMYAEQQFNAFELVVELGLAVEITIDYRSRNNEQIGPRLVSADEIERGIRKLMDDNNNEIRKKVKLKSEECRKCVLEGGSSFISLGKFIHDVLTNSPGEGN